MTMAPDAASARLVLLQWLSPAFPISGFAYSHGLETVIADGTIRSAREVQDWLALLLTHGSALVDASLLAMSLRAMQPSSELAAIAEALSPSAERWEETRDMGRAFLRTTAGLEDSPQNASENVASPEDLPYPVAFGLRARALNLPEEEVLSHFLSAFVANLISVATRMVPLGQTEGQRILAALHPLILRSARFVAAADVPPLTSGAVGSDMASMRHETLDVRHFKT